MMEFWMDAKSGVPLEEVRSIPGMPKDGYVVSLDAPGFGMETKDEWVVAWDRGAAMKGIR